MNILPKDVEMLESRRFDVNQIARVDYSALHQSHEVVLRVELLERRLVVLDAQRNAAVAEVGLGSGDTTRMLARRFTNPLCVDIDAARLDEVEAFIAPELATFREGDAATYDFGESEFDHVFLIGLLEHCQDGEAVLRNVRRALKPQGRIHVLVNNAHSIHRQLGVEIGDIADVHELSAADLAFGHRRVYTPNSLYAEISRAGLIVDYVDQHHMKPLPSKMMDALPLELSRAFVDLGRRYPYLAAYTYLEAVLP